MKNLLRKARQWLQTRGEYAEEMQFSQGLVVLQLLIMGGFYVLIARDAASFGWVTAYADVLNMAAVIGIIFPVTAMLISFRMRKEKYGWMYQPILK